MGLVMLTPYLLAMAMAGSAGRNPSSRSRTRSGLRSPGCHPGAFIANATVSEVISRLSGAIGAYFVSKSASCALADRIGRGTHCRTQRRRFMMGAYWLAHRV